MDKLDMFQYIFGRIDTFIWWYLQIISADEGTQFTSMEFQDKYQTCSVHIFLASPEHQEKERTSWSDMDNNAYDCTITYATCNSFGSLYSFHSNIYGRSYLPGNTNQRTNKQKRRDKHTILTCNRYETFKISFTCFILSVCCTKRYHTCWGKSVKPESPSTKGFLRYPFWNSTASKRKYRLCTTKYGISYLFTMLFFMRFFMMHWNTRHNHIQKLWLCDRLCRTYLMLHL